MHNHEFSVLLRFLERLVKVAFPVNRLILGKRREREEQERMHIHLLDNYNTPMMSENLKEKLARLPETPGVYLMKDDKGRVLYVGKAVSLRDRVRSYFSKQTDPKTVQLAEQIADVEYINAGSEIEALILEARLVKDLKPKFNIKLTDDKSFGCIDITAYDDFAKVWFGREKDPPNGERWGPFPSSSELRRAIRTLQRIFKFATCSLTIKDDDPRRRFFRPCLLYSINRCTAPCAAKISKADYDANIESVRRFLRGEKEQLIQSLAQKMQAAAEELDFERAAEFRDQIRALENIATYFESVEDYDIEPIDAKVALEDLQKHLQLPALPRRIETIDIANIQGKQAVGSLVVFVDGIPFKEGYRRFKIKLVEGIDDFAMIAEVVTRRFRRLIKENASFPEIFMVDGGVGQLNAAAGALAKLSVTPPVLLGLAKREEELFRLGHKGPLPLPKDSLGLRLLMHCRDEAHRFAQHYHHILRRKDVLEE